MWWDSSLALRGGFTYDQHVMNAYSNFLTSLTAALALALSGCTGGDSHKKVADDAVHVMERVATAMSSISDKASAERAVVEMKAAVADFKKLSERAKKLGDPTPEVKAKIEAEMKAQGEVLQKTMMASMGKLAAAGPEALAVLQAALKELLPAMEEAGKMFK